MSVRRTTLRVAIVLTMTIAPPPPAATTCGITAWVMLSVP